MFRRFLPCKERVFLVDMALSRVSTRVWKTGIRRRNAPAGPPAVQQIILNIQMQH